MHGIFTPWVVCLSVVLTAIVCYTALLLAKRISRFDLPRRRTWLAAGTFAVGVGLWASHFLGLLAVERAGNASFHVPEILLAVAVSAATALGILLSAKSHAQSWSRCILIAAGLTLGVAAIHFLDVAALATSPPPQLPIVQSAGALALTFACFMVALQCLRTTAAHAKSPRRVLASLLVAAAVVVFNLLCLSALKIAASAHSPSGIVIERDWFALALGMFALGITALSLLTVIYDAYLSRHVRDRDEALLRANASAQYAARHDALTGLPNRLALVDAAEHAIEESNRHGDAFALMVLNVDRLKPINDSLGHQAGDEMLCEIARRLRGVLRRHDVLARLAGDEFTILARELNSARDAESVLQKIGDALSAPIKIGTLEVHASLSIGVSMFPGDGSSFDLLVRRADAATRIAKETSRGTYRFFTPDMTSAADDRLALESQLRAALEAGQLELHYQPKVDIGTGRVRSAEALIRWRHPQRGLVPPNVFIPVAEETGLIMPIGEWVIREACRQVRRWLDAGMPPLRVSVNLSAKQFRHADLTAVVRSALDEAQLQPGYLELELTESAVMHDPEKSALTLQQLSTMGVHISIDDFGTGYSSLSYLRRFPLDKLKIDRSFVRDLMQNPDDVSIVRAIISLAHSLRLRVVAEGVETLDQLNFLTELGCDQYQGFYCSPAVPPNDFVALIQRIRAGKPEYTEADMLRTQSRLSAFTPAR
ncbi:MAG TPA: EAL domain-containing protein [Steroidobacteraceae bacterium]|nr:EAL domain-containing protein [Steroidobacteraceae bacterium]